MLSIKRVLLFVILFANVINAQVSPRSVENFNKDWKFYYADTTDFRNEYKEATYNDIKWRKLNLPHDWSIEFPFAKENPATPEGGALPGGIGWYRKLFFIPESSKGKQISIEFDGVYRCSDVWINGHWLGFRPNGYISFHYNLTPFLKFGKQNIVVVKVDNSKQVNSRWYSGSGIYRNVRLVTTNNISVEHWGTFVTTPFVSTENASLNIKLKIRNTNRIINNISVINSVVDVNGKEVSTKRTDNVLLKDSLTEIVDNLIGMFRYCC